MLSVTTNIKTKVQIKIKIVKQYVLSQICFELKTYNFGSTWIDQNLDSLVVKYVRDWLEMPISGCVKEMMTLPVSKGGLAIPLLKNVSDQMWLQKRNALKLSTHPDINQIWSDTSSKHILTDSLLSTGNLPAASKELKKIQKSRAENHFYALETQGVAARTISETVPKTYTSLWSSNLQLLSGSLHNFAKKLFSSNCPPLLTWSGGKNDQMPHAYYVTKEPHKLINMFYQIVNHLSLLTGTRSVMTQYSLPLLIGYMIQNWPIKLYL